MDRATRERLGLRTGPTPQNVKFACGHEKPLKDVANTTCPKCKAEAKQARKARRQGQNNGNERRDKRMKNTGRLPDAAVFTCVYSASTETWAGTLSFDGLIFRAKASGVFRVLATLDKMYRDSIVAEAK